jgi:NCAIR mutase (PurE)-related protein
VIGVPTSVGYGAALGSVTFRHADVLFGGLTVVNIDAGSVPPPAALLIAG